MVTTLTKIVPRDYLSQSRLKIGYSVNDNRTLETESRGVVKVKLKRTRMHTQDDLRVLALCYIYSTFISYMYSWNFMSKLFDNVNSSVSL